MSEKIKWDDISFDDFLPSDEELMIMARNSGLIHEEDYINYLIKSSNLDEKDDSSIGYKISFSEMPQGITHLNYDTQTIIHLQESAA